jgi:hypothetical protein
MFNLTIVNWIIELFARRCVIRAIVRICGGANAAGSKNAVTPKMGTVRYVTAPAPSRDRTPQCRCYNSGAVGHAFKLLTTAGSRRRPGRISRLPPAGGAYDETGFEMWRRPLLFSFLSLLVLASAHAMERPFPAAAKRGSMTPAPYPEIVIEGRQRLLAPGARIWNEDNLIQQPASLAGSGLTVNYTEDADGAIDRVWILSPEEANRPPTKQTK